MRNSVLDHENPCYSRVAQDRSLGHKHGLVLPKVHRHVCKVTRLERALRIRDLGLDQERAALIIECRCDSGDGARIADARLRIDGQPDRHTQMRERNKSFRHRAAELDWIGRDQLIKLRADRHVLAQ